MRPRVATLRVSVKVREGRKVGGQAHLKSQATMFFFFMGGDMMHSRITMPRLHTSVYIFVLKAGVFIEGYRGAYWECVGYVVDHLG